jgi:TrmH family RNA methyltransferase
MYPVAKLNELPLKTALKKTALILKGLEVDMASGRSAYDEPVLRAYFFSLCDVLQKRPLPPDIIQALTATGKADVFRSRDIFLRSINELRHAFLRFLGAEAAEWDLIDGRTGTLDPAARRVLPWNVYLEDIRSPYNVGSIMRTAEAFGVRQVWLSPATPLPTHPRAERTSRGAHTSVPFAVSGLEKAAATGRVFALETGGRPLADFPFPASGTVLLGSEELGLSPEALALADGSLGRVSITMAGAKRSLNVAVAFGILMQWWFFSREGDESR